MVNIIGRDLFNREKIDEHVYSLSRNKSGKRRLVRKVFLRKLFHCLWFFPFTGTFRLIKINTYIHSFNEDHRIRAFLGYLWTVSWLHLSHSQAEEPVINYGSQNGSIKFKHRSTISTDKWAVRRWAIIVGWAEQITDGELSKLIPRASFPENNFWRRSLSVVQVQGRIELVWSLVFPKLSM